MDPTDLMMIFKSEKIREGYKEDMNHFSWHKYNPLCPPIRDGHVQLGKKKSRTKTLVFLRKKP
jgi:hypothetical protein